ncbi:MAG: hypothetical protein WC680_11105 [Sulfuricurvum sp.]|jgi:hypothetical protein
MSKILYSDVNLIIYEGSKHITINPKGERFYLMSCLRQSQIYRNATLSINEEGRYVIQGDQTLYTEHDEWDLSREKLLCEHPEELIHKRSFLGFTYYSVDGVMKREVQSRYVCQHSIYQIEERLKILSCTFEEE